MKEAFIVMIRINTWGGIDRSCNNIGYQRAQTDHAVTVFGMYGIDEQDFLNRLDEMTEQAFDDQCTGANPRYPLMREIRQMYLNAYYGDRHFTEQPMPSPAAPARTGNGTGRKKS